MKYVYASLLFALVMIPPLRVSAQAGDILLFRESFDTLRIPLLPGGWSTSAAKLPGGDFSTTASTPYSPPASVLASDARIEQWLCLPALSFTGKKVRALEFYERRSSSFNCGLLCEASPDMLASWLALSDTLTILSSSSYVRRTLTLPPALDNQPSVRIRFRTLGNGTGATGTLRIDDVTISVEPSCDLALAPAVVVPAHIDAGEAALCQVTVHNNAAAGQYSWTLGLVDSTDGTLVDERSVTHRFEAAGDSLPITLSYPSVSPGLHHMRCVLSCPEDENTANNTVSFRLAVGCAPHSVVINEIMYEPEPDEAEYLELYNQSERPLPLEGWTIADAPASKKGRSVIPLSSLSSALAPHSYALIASDSAIFSLIDRIAAHSVRPALLITSSLGLSNAGEDVILYDAAETVIDSLHFTPSWHIGKGSNTGRSLERIHPTSSSNDARSWSTSAAKEGGTPGMQNSVFMAALPADASLVLSPNPFSPDGDGREDFLGITYSLQSHAATIRMRIYDAKGRLVRTLANNEPSTAGGTVIWNGRDDGGVCVRMGIYVIFFEALDADGMTLRTLKAAAVVATVL